MTAARQVDTDTEAGVVAKADLARLGAQLTRMHDDRAAGRTPRPIPVPHPTPRLVAAWPTLGPAPGRWVAQGAQHAGARLWPLVDLRPARWRSLLIALWVAGGVGAAVVTGAAIIASAPVVAGGWWCQRRRRRHYLKLCRAVTASWDACYRAQQLQAFDPAAASYWPGPAPSRRWRRLGLIVAVLCVIVWGWLIAATVIVAADRAADRVVAETVTTEVGVSP